MSGTSDTKLTEEDKKIGMGVLIAVGSVIFLVLCFFISGYIRDHFDRVRMRRQWTSNSGRASVVVQETILPMHSVPPGRIPRAPKPAVVRTPSDGRYLD